VAHSLARALQQAIGVGQGCAVEETDVDVPREDVDVGKGGIAETRGRAAVVDELANFVAAIAYDLKPILGNSSQRAWVLSKPGIDCGVAGDCTVSGCILTPADVPTRTATSVLQGRYYCSWNGGRRKKLNLALLSGQPPQSQDT